MNTVYTAADAKITALVGLDISAAFDTIDHDVLASRLESQLGVVGAASSWLRFYLRGCQQFIRLGRHSSSMTQCDWAPRQKATGQKATGQKATDKRPRDKRPQNVTSILS